MSEGGGNSTLDGVDTTSKYNKITKEIYTQIV